MGSGGIVVDTCTVVNVIPLRAGNIHAAQYGSMDDFFRLIRDYFISSRTFGLHGEEYVCTEVPQHEVPACRAEEGEFSVGALEPNRVLHDAVWVRTVFQAEGVTQFVYGLFF